ncbi:MAG: DUF4446 family protein [Actinomycetota bacterium]|jgi:hypothetical protein
MPTGPDLIAVVLGALALIVSIAVFLSFAAVRRRLIMIQGRGKQEDLLEAVSGQIEEVRGLRTDIQQLAADLQTLAEAFRGALQRFAVYRYDAFEDMGGQLSFSAALLNDHGDGLVISCINGRQEARTYAKPIQRAASAYNLSPEEQEAIRLALVPLSG